MRSARQLYVAHDGPADRVNRAHDEHRRRSQHDNDFVIAPVARRLTDELESAHRIGQPEGDWPERVRVVRPDPWYVK
jgi:hypothetical protein